MKKLLSLSSIVLTGPQRAALAGALTFGVRSTCRNMSFHRKDSPKVTFAAVAPLQTLLDLGLIEPSRFVTFDFVASKRGILLGKMLGLDTQMQFDAPKRLAERAVKLRLLTAPSAYAVGDTDNVYPQKMRSIVGRDLLWIEQLGYGRFEKTNDQCGSVQLNLTRKGQKLVSATDTPITIRLTEEMQRHLRAGTMTKVMLPDVTPGLHHACNHNGLKTSTDWMQSPRSLHERLYEPMAVYPGTEVRLVDAKTGKRVATAKAGEWDRIWFRANEDGGRAIFDMNYEYSRYWALDQFDRRIWVAFPFNPEYSEYHGVADALAHECGFDDRNSMRATWLARMPRASKSKKRKKDFHGLMIDISGVEFVKSEPPKNRVITLRVVGGNSQKAPKSFPCNHARNVQNFGFAAAA